MNDIDSILRNDQILQELIDLHLEKLHNQTDYMNELKRLEIPILNNYADFERLCFLIGNVSHLEKIKEAIVSTSKIEQLSDYVQFKEIHFENSSILARRILILLFGEYDVVQFTDFMKKYKIPDQIIQYFTDSFPNGLKNLQKLA